MEGLKAQKVEALALVAKYMKYQEYLESVLEVTDMFHQVDDLLARHSTLETANTDLRQAQWHAADMTEKTACVPDQPRAPAADCCLARVLTTRGAQGRDADPHQGHHRQGTAPEQHHLGAEEAAGRSQTRLACGGQQDVSLAGCRCGQAAPAGPGVHMRTHAQTAADHAGLQSVACVHAWHDSSLDGKYKDADVKSCRLSQHGCGSRMCRVPLMMLIEFEGGVQIKLTSDNLYQRCKQRTGSGAHAPDLDTSGQLTFVGNFISDLAFIVNESKLQRTVKA